MSKELELLRRALEFIPENTKLHGAPYFEQWEVPHATKAERLRYEGNRAAERLERAEALTAEIEALLPKHSGRTPGPPREIGQRQSANQELVTILADLIERHPDLRFGQLLITHGFLVSQTVTTWPERTVYVENPFNEEPLTTLKRVEEKR